MAAWEKAVRWSGVPQHCPSPAAPRMPTLVLNCGDHCSEAVSGPNVGQAGRRQLCALRDGLGAWVACLARVPALGFDLGRHRRRGWCAVHVQYMHDDLVAWRKIAGGTGKGGVERGGSAGAVHA
eukprot:357474-Chlamydomonas_euryale.AAC.1